MRRKEMTTYKTRFSDVRKQQSIIIAMGEILIRNIILFLSRIISLNIANRHEHDKSCFYLKKNFKLYRSHIANWRI